MIIGMGTKLVHKQNCELTTRTAGTVVVGEVYEHHIGMALHLAVNLIATLNKVATHSFSKL